MLKLLTNADIRNAFENASDELGPNLQNYTAYKPSKFLS